MLLPFTPPRSAVVDDPDAQPAANAALPKADTTSARNGAGPPQLAFRRPAPRLYGNLVECESAQDVFTTLGVDRPALMQGWGRGGQHVSHRWPSCQGQRRVLAGVGEVPWEHGRPQHDRVDGGDVEPGDRVPRSRRAAPTATPRRSRSAGAACPATRTSRASTCGSGRGASSMPLRWRRPRMIFVNSMSDLFHEEIPRRVHRRRCSTSWAAPTGTPSRSSRSATSGSRSSPPQLAVASRTSGWAYRSRTAGSSTAPTPARGARSRAVHLRRAAARPARRARP